MGALGHAIRPISLRLLNGGYRPCVLSNWFPERLPIWCECFRAVVAGVDGMMPESNSLLRPNQKLICEVEKDAHGTSFGKPRVCLDIITHLARGFEDKSESIQHC